MVIIHSETDKMPDILGVQESKGEILLYCWLSNLPIYFPHKECGTLITLSNSEQEGC